MSYRFSNFWKKIAVIFLKNKKTQSFSKFQDLLRLGFCINRNRSEDKRDFLLGAAKWAPKDKWKFSSAEPYLYVVFFIRGTLVKIFVHVFLKTLLRSYSLKFSYTDKSHITNTYTSSARTHDAAKNTPILIFLDTFHPRLQNYKRLCA